MWLVQLIHSVAFGVVPYSAVSGIGFTKSIVKQKHVANKRIIKVEILVGHDRMLVKKHWDEIHGKTIGAFYLVSHNMFYFSSIGVRSL